MSDIKEYGRSYSFSEGAGSDSGDITAYETLDGTIESVSSGGSSVLPIKVKKTYYQDSPVLDVHPGDTFVVEDEFGEAAFGSAYTWANLSVLCDSSSISDEIVRFIPPDNVLRLWKVTLEGTTVNSGSEDGINTRRMEVELSEELNGTTERTVSGRLVALLNSATPIARLRIGGTGTEKRCPYRPGNTYSYLNIVFLVTSSSSKRSYHETAGMELYEYSVECEV
jgi:hypothetical protein